MIAKTGRFEMRLEPELIDEIDAWRARQPDLPTRSDAIRKLVQRGLVAAHPKSAQFTQGERMIMAMLADMMRAQQLKTETDPDFIRESLFGGHYWSLPWRYPGIFHNHVDSPESVEDVVKILDMWRFLEDAYSRFDDAQKAELERREPLFGKNLRFPGFWGNGEGEHLGIAYHLIDRLDRFTTLKGRSLDSHAPMLDVYERMLAAFEPIPRKLMGRDMTVDEVATVLSAMTHPANR